MDGSRQGARPITADLRLALQVLDHQIVDVDGFHCGNVDDVVLRRRDDGSLQVAGLLVGPGVVASRMRSRVWRWIATAMGEECIRVPIAAVSHFDGTVHLAVLASSLGLDAREQRAVMALDRLRGKRRPGGRPLPDSDRMPPTGAV